MCAHAVRLHAAAAISLLAAACQPTEFVTTTVVTAAGTSNNAFANGTMVLDHVGGEGDADVTIAAGFVCRANFVSLTSDSGEPVTVPADSTVRATYSFSAQGFSNITSTSCALSLQIYDTARGDAASSDNSGNFDSQQFVDGVMSNTLPPEPAGPWDCIGELPTPTFVPGSSAVSLRLEDASLVGELIAGATTSVCTHADASCATPLATGTTDAMGEVTLDVSISLPVYFDITASGYYPALFMRNKPLPQGNFERFLFPFSNISMGNLLVTLGVPANLGAGHALVTVRDCDGTSASEVTVTASVSQMDTVVAYLNDDLTDNQDDATDVTGVAFIANLPPGPVDITGVRASTGEVIGVRRANIRAGAVTFVSDMSPTPAPSF